MGLAAHNRRRRLLARSAELENMTENQSGDMTTKQAELENMTVEELRNYADKHGITIAGTVTRKESIIIRILQAGD